MDGEEEADSPKEAATGYSAALTESFTMHKSAALAVELAANPSIALVAVTHAFVLSQFGLDLGLHRSQTCLQLSIFQPYLKEVKDSPALFLLQEQKQQWISVLPRSEDELWAWCLGQNQDVLLKLLAFCAARGVNAVQAKHESEDHQRLQHANALSVALQVDMTKWFVPTADNFFGRISKSQIGDCLTEMGKGTSVGATLKKNKLAELAESEVEGTGWLPRTLRSAEIQPEAS